MELLTEFVQVLTEKNTAKTSLTRNKLLLSENNSLHLLCNPSQYLCVQIKPETNLSGFFITVSLRSTSIPIIYIHMIKETIELKLKTGEHCILRMTQLNHNVVALQPEITLISSTIPHNCFQDIVDHIITLDKPYIKSLYFESVNFNYKIISFNLFGHVRAAFKKELKNPIPYDKLINNTDNYSWIEPAFLPKFPDNIDEILTLAEKQANCLLLATKKGSFRHFQYQLVDPKINYNYVYDLHPTDLIPIFDTFISATLYVLPTPPYNVTKDDIEALSLHLKGMYYTLTKINLKLY